MSTMLRLSEAASLALHTMRLLAATTDRRLTTREIASKLSVSEAHLAKVLQRLVRRGLVESVRGPKGGSRLAGEPSEITMMDVYEAIEGPLAADTCLLGRSMCVNGECMFRGLLETINTLARQHMKETTLAELAAR